MAEAPILKVEGLSTHFTRNPRRAMLYGLADLAADIIPGLKPRSRLRHQEFGAVNDLSFTLARGEAVAICGRNGAGKTTLLRTIAGLLKPASGSVKINGRVNSIIELGRGLIPHLSGRENARLNLVWRGVTLEDLRRVTGEVNDFAELGDAFDQPVGSYSSGMRSRLAFAIAVSTPCDLMLVDEVLAVGDLQFQHKCLKNMQRFIEEGGSLLLVSHQIGQMQSVCKRGLIIEHGRLEFDGPMEQCAMRLLEMQGVEDFAQEALKGPKSYQSGEASAAGPVRIDAVTIRGAAGQGDLGTGDALEIEVAYSSTIECEAILSCEIATSDQSLCVTILMDPELLHLTPGSGARLCRVPNVPLRPGCYTVNASLCDPVLIRPFSESSMHTGTQFFVREGEASRFDVMRKFRGQLIDLPSVWSEPKHTASSSQSKLGNNSLRSEVDHVN